MPKRGTPLSAMLLGIFVAIAAIYPPATRAQGAPSARDFLNTPVNSAAIFVDYLSTNSETAADSDLPLPNNEAVTRLGTATILYSFPMDGRYAGVQVTGGYAKVKITGPFGEVETSGLMDPAIGFHANIFGLPALEKEQFAQAIPQNYMTFHFTVNPPLGRYDRDDPVNTGANRWAFNPLVNLDLTPDEGVSWFDFYAGGRFFTDNNAFQGNNQLSQHPLAIFAAHYSHNIGKLMWVSVGVYYDNGGETFINGIPQHNSANGFRPGASISRAFGPFRVTLRWENTASTPHAEPNNFLLSLRVSTLLF
jgi:hypothetical protein